jgi:hypothetical protein
MSKETVRESIAAVGVIASLVFVGFQVRQANIQARAAAYQSIGIATAAAFDSWAHDAEFTATSKGLANMDSTDWRRWALKMTVFARLGETVLLQVQQGLLPPDAMERLGYGGWRDTIEEGPVGCVWPLIRPGVSASFREYVEAGKDVNRIDCSGYAIPVSF